MFHRSHLICHFNLSIIVLKRWHLCVKHSEKMTVRHGGRQTPTYRADRSSGDHCSKPTRGNLQCDSRVYGELGWQFLEEIGCCRGFVVVLMSSLIRPSRDRNKHLETFECCCEGVIGTTSWSFKDGVFAFLEKLSRNEIVIAVTVS